MTGRPPATTSRPRGRAVVAMILLAAVMPLAAHLAPDLAVLCWSAGAVLAAVALTCALRARRAER
jgi:hypothetical protein